MVIRRPILEYIQRMETEGYYLKDIKDSLLQSGYRERDVNDSIEEAKRLTFKDEKRKKRPPYASWWMRLIAYTIDLFLLGCVYLLLSIMIAASLGGIFGIDATNPATYSTVLIFGFIISWLYHALMESGTHRGTIGMVLMQIEVTTLHNKTITFGQATGRFFARFVSAALLLIGFLMMTWTKKRQCLHDILAQTLVQKKESVYEPIP